MKKENGVTLITLIITIIILIILTFTLSVNVDQIGEQNKRTRFESDLKSLQEEVNQYYARVKELPIINKYTNTSMLEEIKNVNDGDEYYVLDIKQLQVKLNYGNDYIEIENNRDTLEEISDLTDVYIINKQSHTIYYPKGIEYDGKIHYSIIENYTMIKVEGYVNKPELLTGMDAIKFTVPTETNEATVIKTTSSDENWYNYQIGNWANAQTQDGSMWVWIPRYAYRINSNTKTTDVVFLIGKTDNYYDENGAIQTAKRQTKVNETINTNEGYTVHPAFTDESSINYANGGWDKELTGIWVAKFEAGYASGNNNAKVKASSVYYTEPKSLVKAIEANTTNDSSQVARNWLDGVYAKVDNDGTMTYGNITYSWINGKEAIKYPTFQGVTYAMNYINHNDAYNISRVLTESGNIYGLTSLDTDSHLMKNSEWGAVSYLSKSQYGLKGTNIYINNVSLDNSTTSVYAITGMGGNSENAEMVTTTIEKIKNKAESNVCTWKEVKGTKASSTGTIYGIYDLSGGQWERTASLVHNGNSNLSNFGSSLLNNGISTKYVTVYPNNDSGETVINTASQKNYEANTKIYGDALRETSTAGTGLTAWYSDHTLFPAYTGPFFVRGSMWNSKNGAGLFSFGRANSANGYYYGFRTVLVKQ